MKNVILLGYGNMGSSLAKGWSLNKNYNFFVIEKEIILKQKSEEDGFQSFQNINEMLNNTSIENLDIVFLAVKPQQMNVAIQEIVKSYNQKTLFISIAAGLSFSWFQNEIDSNVKIIRAMPNTPASVGRGITGYCKNQNVTENEKQDAHNLLSSIGKAVFLSNENLIDVVTAISGSGPAYIFYFVEALAEIGVSEGLEEHDANLLALETLIGSAKLLDKSKIYPKILRQNVTSPGGTTEAALDKLMSRKNGLLPLLKATISSAIERAKSLNSSN